MITKCNHTTDSICAECTRENERVQMLEIVKAVAHIGVDFGYGRYELEAHHIDNARAILKNGFDTHNSYEEAQEAAFHDQLP